MIAERLRTNQGGPGHVGMRISLKQVLGLVAIVAISLGVFTVRFDHRVSFSFDPRVGEYSKDARQIKYVDLFQREDIGGSSWPYVRFARKLPVRQKDRKTNSMIIRVSIIDWLKIQMLEGPVTVLEHVPENHRFEFH